MNRHLVPSLARAYLVVLLLGTVLAAPTPQAVLLLGTFLVAPNPQVWIALVLLLLQTAVLYRPPPPRFDLVFTVVTLLLVSTGLAPLVGPVPATLLLLPALLLPDAQLHALKTREELPPFRLGLWTTRTLNALGLTLGASGILGVVAGAPSLLGAALLLLVGLAFRVGQEVRILRNSPFYFESRRLRVLVASQGRLTLAVTNRAPCALRAGVSSSYPGLAILPEELPLDTEQSAELEVTVTPSLAGPGQPTLQVATTGPWGLLAAGYSVAPLELHVIPRARYATWLARRYLEATREGQRAPPAGLAPPTAGRPRGIEFQGLREYQPGDALRDIEWRHTFKFNELIVKARQDPPQGDAVLLVNLVVAKPEEADWLAYHLVMSSLTAARQGLSASLLAYNELETVLATGHLAAGEALKEALRLSTQLRYGTPVEHMLAPPDVRRVLRAIRDVGGDAQRNTDGGLARFLRLELDALEALASRHPVTSLVEQRVLRMRQDSTITVVSRWNHDAEALAVALPRLRSRGYRVIDLLSEQGPAWTS